MNPNGGETQPKIEYAPSQSAEEAKGSLPEKTGVVNPENSAQRQSVQTTSQIVSDLAIPTSTVVTTNQPSATPVQQAATAASDNDRIEKEWIDKAKDIISKTQDDPFEQKEAMSKVKAEYIQKRFNKTIKTDSKKH